MTEPIEFRVQVRSPAGLPKHREWFSLTNMINFSTIEEARKRAKEWTSAISIDIWEVRLVKLTKEVVE